LTIDDSGKFNAVNSRDKDFAQAKAERRSASRYCIV